jgi:hypothetical protein
MKEHSNVSQDSVDSTKGAGSVEGKKEKERADHRIFLTAVVV